MDESPFSGLYAPLLDVSAYLKRIGYRGVIGVNIDCLTEIMECQLDTVPFENLDVFHAHKEPSLDTDALFNKIVLERRGGYCFELNGLFWRLLESVGFFCWCAAARIIMGREYLTPLAHRVIIVELDGRKYFCDVGFGGPIPASPLEITYGKILTCAAGRSYRFEKDSEWTTLLLQKDGGFMPMMAFREVPCDPVEFIPLNTFCACSDVEPFLKKQMVWRLSRSGRVSIDGDILRIEKNGAIEEKRLNSEEELRTALIQWFGIEYAGGLRDWKS